MLKKAFVLTAISFTFVFTYLTTSKVNAYTLDRSFGSNRYQTAISISQNGWTNSDYVIIANGEDFPDALSASPLAAYYNAPILLTAKDSISDETLNELKRLKVKKVLIIGGPGVVSNSIKSSIENLKYDEQTKTITCDRIYGDNRFATSVAVAKQLPNSGEIAVLSGENFPDALSMAPFAAKNKIPIVLVSKSEVSPSLKDYINENNINKTYIIGGPGVINDIITKSFNNPERIYGQNRYETNTKVIQRFSDIINISKTFVASGDNFPDGLAGSALAAKSSSPIVLTSKSPDNTTRDFIYNNLDKISNLSILGGSGVIPPDLIQNLVVNRKLGNSPGNTNNRALVASRNGWIYDGVPGYSGIRKIKADGSESELFGVNSRSEVNVTDKYIFYINESDNYKLYRMNLDGTDNKSINYYNSIYKYVIYDNYIYYQNSTDNGKIYRMNLDGGENKKILDDIGVSNLNVTENYIYYIIGSDSLYSGKLYRVNRDGSNKTIIRDSNVAFPVVWGNSIYFADNNYNISKINLDGTGYQKLNDDKSYYLNIQGDTIYYTNWSDIGNIYSIKLDGSSRKVVNAEASYDINIAGNIIYFRNDNDGYERISIPELETETKFDSYQRGNTVGNIVNKAFVAQQGDYMYSVDYNSYKISSSKLDGSEKKILANYYGEVSGFNVLGNYLYYSRNRYGDPNPPFDIGGRGIYRIKTDGTGTETLLAPGHTANLTVMADWIYYISTNDSSSDTGLLSKVKTDGTGHSFVTKKHGRSMNVVNNWIYYINVDDNNSVYKVRTDGTEETKVYGGKDKEVVGLILSEDGNYAYIAVKDYGSIRLSLKDGSEISTPNNMPNLINSGNKLFYIKGGTEKIYSSNLDGSSEEFITDCFSYGGFNIIGDNLYYYETQGKLKVLKIK